MTYPNTETGRTAPLGLSWIRGAWLAAPLVFATVLSAHAADKFTVALNAGTAGGYVTYIAKDKGYFKDENIDLQYVKVTSPGAGSAAVASGDGDVAVFGMNVSFFNLASTGDFVIIAGVTEEHKGFAGQAYIASNAAYAKGLHSVADFANKKIGIGGRGAAGEYGLIVLTDKYHVPFNGNALVVLGGDANIMAAIKAGSIDAGASGSATLAIAADRRGEGKLLSLLGDEVPGISSNVIYTSPKTVANKRDVLVRFMRAYLRAAAVYASVLENRDANGNFSNPAAADDLLKLISTNNTLGTADIASGLPYVPADGHIDSAEVTRQLLLWKRVGMLEPNVKSDVNLVDTSIIEAAKKK